MFWLKCCPRCSGDLYEGGDIHGSFIACLQCSHYLTEVDEVILRDSSRHKPGVYSNASVVTRREIVSDLTRAKILELTGAGSSVQAR